VIDLSRYADLTVHVGLNLQPGQRLLIIGPLASGGVSLEAAPFVREITASAYRAGASLVEAIWGDEALLMARFKDARGETFSRFSRWLPEALSQHADAGDAILSVFANDPDQLHGQDVARVSALQQATARAMMPFRERISRNDVNWTVVAAAAPSWARKVFPAEQDEAAAVAQLWDAIARLCRLDRPDPVAAWRTHLDALAARKDRLNASRFQALKYHGPGTDLTIGLPEAHQWVSGHSYSRAGILFAPNVPTEEVFTMPHKDRVNGVVTATKPLSFGGTLIEGFELTFADGRVVEARAEKGGDVLREMLATDEGAARLGEIALVADSTPISQSGLLFYNTLFDENAASHLALGSAYKFTCDGGEGMTEAAFEAAGGNRSAIHVDFMIGSGALDVDGVRPDGTTEPVMRGGEWAD
jgi:aminopeptidase